jgi:hypothetical protein
VSAIGEIAATVGRPRHDVRDPGWNLLVAAGAAVGLRGGVARDRPDEPIAVGSGIHPLDTASRPGVVDRYWLVITAVMTTRAHIQNISAALLP